jgi:hypothetical protein
MKYYLLSVMQPTVGEPPSAEALAEIGRDLEIGGVLVVLCLIFNQG